MQILNQANVLKNHKIKHDDLQEFEEPMKIKGTCFGIWVILCFEKERWTQMKTDDVRM